MPGKVRCECCWCEVTAWTGYLCADTKDWRDTPGRLFLCRQCVRFTLGEFAKQLTKAQLLEYVRRAREELRPRERCEEPTPPANEVTLTTTTRQP